MKTKKKKREAVASTEDFAKNLGLDPLIFTKIYNKFTIDNCGSRSIDFDDVRKILRDDSQK